MTANNGRPISECGKYRPVGSDSEINEERTLEAMHRTLSVSRHARAVDLRSQAAVVISALGVTKFEERFSSNYPPDGHYFLGFGVNASIKVCDADDKDPSDHPYWVAIDEPVPWGDAVDTLPTDSTTVASLLQKAGMQSKAGLD